MNKTAKISRRKSQKRYMTQSELDLPKVIVDHDVIAVKSFCDSPDSFPE